LSSYRLWVHIWVQIGHIWVQIGLGFKTLSTRYAD